MDNKTVAPVRTLEEIKECFSNIGTGFDSKYVLKRGDKEISEKKLEEGDLHPSDYAYKALTLFEFDKGVLLASSVPELYKTFAADFLIKLRAEYNCQTPSENATAELTTVNFVRTLEIQKRINSYLEKGSIDTLGAKYLQIMSQELDRANRHYLVSLMALKTMRQPQMQVSIKTQTAVIGQNQVIQTKNG